MNLDLALCVLLLTAPADNFAPMEGFAHLAPQLQLLAVSLEILDIRETGYILARPRPNFASEFTADLGILRHRWAELRDAPPLHDAQRLPGRDLVLELLTFNRAYRAHLDGRQTIELIDPWALREAQQETDRLYEVYDLMRDCRVEYYYVSVRRHALLKLRERVGYEAYYRGAWPVHVPIWRFAGR